MRCNMHCNGFRMAAIFMSVAVVLPVMAQEIPLVTVEKVLSTKTSVPKTYVGQFTAIDDIMLIPRVTGFIKKMNFKDGTMVKKGQLLFEIEDTTYVAKVKSFEAQLAQCQATEAYTQSEYIRNKRLRAKDAVSVTVYENALRQHLFAQAAKKVIEAELMDARNNLSYTKIYAPISGRAGKSTLSPGNLVTPSTGNLCEIVSLSPIRVKFALSERVFYKEFGGMQGIRKNAIIKVKLADGSVYPEVGEVEIVDNKFNTSTNTVRIWARFKNSDQKLFPGGFATVILSSRNRGNLTRIPTESVITQDNGTFVYVVDSKMNAHLRKVELGNSAVKYQEIISGLKPGETVVKYGTHKVTDGKPIRVK